MTPKDPMVPLPISVQSGRDELDCYGIIPISSDRLDPLQAARDEWHICERCRGGFVLENDWILTF
jgi:hypothetical protein